MTTNPTGLFKTQLEQLDIPFREYLMTAKMFGFHSRGKYNPGDLFYSDDDEHKLQLHTKDNGIVRFGRVGYDDFIIYSILERRGEREKGTAGSKRMNYLKRARAIEGDWKTNKFSPNRLAMRILWSDSK